MRRVLATAAFVSLVACGGSEPAGVTDAEYARWREECTDLATSTLDTRLHRVGGNRWVDEVNRCLLEKAKD